MPELTLKTVTETEWHKRKKEAGIPSSGIFAKAEQKNNIGPAITAYRKAAKELKVKYSDGTVVAAHKALIKLDEAITKFVGGEALKGNRELNTPAAQQLGKELVALRNEVRTKLEKVNQKVGNTQQHEKLKQQDAAGHKKFIFDQFPV